MNDARILVIDDEQEILEMIQIVLNKEGFHQVETALNGLEGIRIGKSFQPNIIVLDVMMPGLDGFEVCQKLREFTNVPIFFLTARNTDLDKLHGFSMGADDYITKPFHPLELVARMKAQLRRNMSHLFFQPNLQQEKVHEWKNLRINETSGQLFINGKEVPCPAMEFKLLVFLVSNPNRIFSKKQIYEQVWGEESLGDDHTVMVHIRRLREKIEESASKPRLLVTVRGLGYKFVPPRKES